MASTLARICRGAPLTIGVAALAAGMLTVACGSNGATAPTTSTTTTTTTTTSSAADSGGGGGAHHERHDSGGGAGAPADTAAPGTVTVDPSTVTNTETDIQTTVQTSIATSTQTVTATTTYQPRDEYPRNDNRSQFGPQQGH